MAKEGKGKSAKVLLNSQEANSGQEQDIIGQTQEVTQALVRELDLASVPVQASKKRDMAQASKKRDTAQASKKRDMAVASLVSEPSEMPEPKTLVLEPSESKTAEILQIGAYFG